MEERAKAAFDSAVKEAAERFGAPWPPTESDGPTESTGQQSQRSHLMRLTVSSFGKWRNCRRSIRISSATSWTRRESF